MRRQPTDAERALWHLLRAHRFAATKWKRQQPIGSYIVDFVCFDRRLIVEADGGQHAESTYDLTRDAWLRVQNFTVLRFWNDHILNNAEGVATAILAALERRRGRHRAGPAATPSPRPSPARGEGEHGALNG